MKNKILYVTTFNEKLYELSGRYLIDTFKKHNVEGQLLVCTEGMEASQIRNKGGVAFYDATHDEFRQKILQENKDIVDVQYGGQVRSWPKGRDGDFNRHWPRFFWKVVALSYALRGYGDSHDVIVQLDCDIKFSSCLSEKNLEKLFGDAGVFYCLGPQRRRIQTGIEAGVVGFRREVSGYEFLKTYINVFDSGKFRAYYRKDDGLVLKIVVESNPQFKTRDLVGSHPLKARAPVIPYSPLAAYLEHDKGLHKHYLEK